MACTYACSLSLSLSLSPFPGDYRFSIEMTNLTAAGSVELWLSIDANPLNMNRILTLEYSDLVRLMCLRI